MTPKHISELMTPDQIERLEYWLKKVITHGYGAVRITVHDSHVHLIQAEISEKLPVPEISKNSLTPDDN